MSKATNRYFSEVRERAVRLVLDNQGQHESRWSTLLSISSKIGCAPQTLNEWVKKAGVDRGGQTGVTTEMAGFVSAVDSEKTVRRVV
jgi:transposase-like protein